MRVLFSSCVVTTSLLLGGCAQSVEPPPLRALERSGKVALLCREMVSGEGRDMRACPDTDDAPGDDEDRRTFALLTQTLRGEVAVIDLHAAATGDTVNQVIDQDPSIPGKEFLTVGKMPTGIVATPGGVATFVGVAEPGRESIFALPTTCIVPPASKKEPARDISLWSACRLPSAPGEMAVIVDPTEDVSGGYRASCALHDVDYWNEAASLPGDAQAKRACPANLEPEENVGPRGRRKLVVTLPDEGKIAIFDAQTILNLPAGAFDNNCVPDQVIALRTTVPNTDPGQVIPPELIPSDTCSDPTAYRYAKISYDPAGVQSQPAGIAVTGSMLYVADRSVPLIHRIDLSDPCSASEIEPLRPLSFDVPGDAVYTDRVSVSALLPSGKRFLYASVDKVGDAMAFDISPGVASVAPIVRQHSLALPLEPPDRIRFESPIKDLALVQHDVPAVSSRTDTAEVGVLCAPDPKEKSSALGTLYRTNSDYTEGAAPRKLRGLFGLMALDSGQIAAVDIEDWDAPCRRPATNNPDPSNVDWLGCANVPGVDVAAGFMKSGSPTVSDEASCNVVEPHRVRSGHYFLTDADHGSNAPNLTSFPILTGSSPQSSASTGADREKATPRMLAVPFDDLDCNSSTPGATLPFTFVGTTKYAACSGLETLPVDPESSVQNSLLLPLKEPRVFAARENFTATFEGVVASQRQNGRLPKLAGDASVAALGRVLGPTELLLQDGDGALCDQGIQDVAVEREVAKELGLSKSANVESFSRSHADYVRLMSEFPENEPYFSSKAAAKACGVDDLRASCLEWFGTVLDPEDTRELLVTEAYHQQMVLTPRNASTEARRKAQVEQIHCCFPGGVSYEVRASRQWVVRGSRLLHDIVPGQLVPGAGLRCERGCNPRSARLRNRVFEISSRAEVCAADAADRSTCFIGPPESGVGSEFCVTDDPGKGVTPKMLASGAGNVAPACVFDSLKSRFAIYRGLEPSVRDMSFSWTVNGGFTVLASSMVSSTTGYSVMPAQVTYSEPLDALVVVDGVSGGLSLVGMQFFAPLGQPYQ